MTSNILLTNQSRYLSQIKFPKNEKYDKFYKGPFLIKKIRHDFFNGENPKHQMNMQLVKDSLEEKLDNVGPIEPSAETAAAIEEYKYN